MTARTAAGMSTATTFPRLLRRAWGLADPASARAARCDAEDGERPHRRLETVAGAYWICGSCGQLHRDDVPTDLAAIYDERWDERLATTAPSRRDVEECQRWLARLEAYRGTGRLFEVGCGLGLLLETAAKAGWAVEGSELSTVAARHASQRSGGDVRPGPIESVELPEGVFDVVLCNNVFEHLREPGAVLVRLGRALRPGGVMFFQTLSAQSLSLRAAPTHWLYYDEGHLFVPTLVSLDHYFRRAALRRLRFESHGFRSAPRAASIESGRERRHRLDKLVASLAGRLGRGHRVKILLERAERDRHVS